MPRFLPDTSCMIAALCTWHEHHERAVREIERRLDGGESLVVAAPALVEGYAVLTGLSAPHRLSPGDALALLVANFMADGVEMVALGAEAYGRLLRAAPERRVAGGALYDAVIIACAQAGNVESVLTFNERQFRRLAIQGVEIVVPL